MSKPTVARKRSPALVPLEDVTIIQVEDFKGKRQPVAYQDVIETEQLSLALDFWGRLHYRRLATRHPEWTDGEVVQNRLMACLELLRILDSGMDVSAYMGDETDARELLNEMIELLAARAGMATDTPIARARRYEVKVKNQRPAVKRAAA